MTRLITGETARIDVTGCDYRVPRGVQHALFTVGRAEMTLEDTDFADVQLISTQASVIEARRLTGNFEVIVLDDSTMRLAEIPSVPEAGSIWVWVEFGDGTVADYTPPMPGYVESWSFPPPDSSGIEQTITVDRCRTLLWPRWAIYKWPDAGIPSRTTAASPCRPLRLLTFISLHQVVSKLQYLHRIESWRRALDQPV